MNQPAIDTYLEHDIDLTREYLEIAVCAQHNNGGLKVNHWWESNIKHLFPVGEVSGTHGVYRPGGSALNSGQVGSLRAALYISRRYTGTPLKASEFQAAVSRQVKHKYDFAANMISTGAENSLLPASRSEIRERMTAFGAHIRRTEDVRKAKADAWRLYSKLKAELKISAPQELPVALRNLDLCLTHALYLEAIEEYLEKGGQSRGSCLVLTSEGEKPVAELSDDWRFALNTKDAFVEQKVLEIRLDADSEVKKEWVDVRPLPDEDTWFENVWNKYMKDEIVR
jgi:hypothetical protein